MNAPPLRESVWVFHAGALGDHVMIWPLVRSLARQGTRVTVVAAGSHARLCERVVGGQLWGGAGGVVGIDGERARFNALWRGPEAVKAEWIEPGATAVVAFVAGADDDAGAVWCASAARMFPNAEFVFVGRPDDEDGASQRRKLWKRAGVADLGRIEMQRNDGGPIVLYLGAGSESKRLSDAQWGGVVALLLREASLGDAPIHVVLGRNEIESGDSAEAILHATEDARVRVVMCEDADALAEELWTARMVVGADTGPMHLSAQMGVPTMAIFGPTDVRIWAPTGPRVRVIAADGGVIGRVEPELIVREFMKL
jgi:hypothetical protein